MAAIDSYSVDSTINDADKVIGSDSANSNVTRNFRMDDISDYVRSNIVISDIGDVTSTEYAILDGATVTTAELNILDGVTATTAEINILDGVTATTSELNFVDGVTSSIQSQIDGKQSTITGAASTVTSSNLTASRALVADSTGKIAVSPITDTELRYLDGVTSSVQTQIDNIDQFDPENTGNANQILQRTSTGYQWVDASAASYTLLAATNSTLGGVIVPLSSEIEIDSSGNITLGNLSANKITSGVLGSARIPDITASKVDAESSNDGYVLTSDGSGNASWEASASGGHTIQDDGADVTTRANLNFQSPLTVTDDSTNDATVIDISLSASDIPNLSTGKITSGELNRSRLSSDTPTDNQVLTWDNTNSQMVWSNKGSATVVFGDGAGEISTWAQGNDTTEIPVSKIPDITGEHIASGSIDLDRLAQDGATTNQVLTWDGTNWNAADSGNSYQLPIADADTLGGVIIEDSSDIDVDSDGKLTLGNISGDKITSGTISSDRVAALATTKITSGVFTRQRLSTDTPTDGQVLAWDNDNSQMVWNTVTSGNADQFANQQALEDFITNKADFRSDINAMQNYTIGDGLEVVTDTLQVDLNGTSLTTEDDGIRISFDHNFTGEQAWVGNHDFGSASTVDFQGTLQIGGTTVSSTAAEINVLDGIPSTLTATELGYVDGVTSAIQTQLNSKQPSLTDGTNTNQYLKWDGDSWEPATISDTDTTYTGGNGIDITNEVVSVDLNGSSLAVSSDGLSVNAGHNQNWSTTQSFQASVVAGSGGSEVTNITEADSADAANRKIDVSRAVFVGNKSSYSEGSAFSDAWYYNPSSINNQFVDVFDLDVRSRFRDDTGVVDTTTDFSLFNIDVQYNDDGNTNDVAWGKVSITNSTVDRGTPSNQDEVEILLEDKAFSVTTTQGTNNAVEHFKVDETGVFLSDLDGTGSHLTVASDGKVSRTTISGSVDQTADYNWTGDNTWTINDNAEDWTFTNSAGRAEIDLVNSSTAADNAILGNIGFFGNNDNATPEITEYANISVTATDVSDGFEKAQMSIKLINNGSLRELIRIDDNDINIFDNINVENATASIALYDTSTPSFNGTSIGAITFDGNDSNGDKVMDLSGITAVVNDRTPNDTKGQLNLSVATSGTPSSTTAVDALRIRPDNIEVNTATPLRIGGDNAANELDDYEEGTWTAASNTAGITLVNVTGGYVKIGRFVKCHAKIGVPTNTNAGTVRIAVSSLPFTVASYSLEGTVSGYRTGTTSGTSPEFVSPDILLGVGLNSIFLDDVGSGSNQEGWDDLSNRTVWLNLTYYTDD